MLWGICLGASVGALVLAVIGAVAITKSPRRIGRHLNIFHILALGVALASVIMHVPAYYEIFPQGTFRNLRTFLLSVYNTIRLFVVDTDYFYIVDQMPPMNPLLEKFYLLHSALIHLLAPIMTFGVVLSFFKNISAYIRYLWEGRQDVYVFSELNAKSVCIARDLLKNNPKRCIVFTDVFEANDEESFELQEQVWQMRAICFKNDIMAVNFRMPRAGKSLNLFTLGHDETENLDQAIALVEKYRNKPNINLYVFSSTVESELLLANIQKGQMKVRRINEIRSLVYRLLGENGFEIFDRAVEDEEGIKHINAVIVGMGKHGTELAKALSWYCQMDGYRVRIDCFDKDSLAQDRFTALCPELMDPKFNGTQIPGETRYTIRFHNGFLTDTGAFAREVKALPATTYAFVALGDDEQNVRTAVNLRMLFGQQGSSPMIQTVVFNSAQRRALEGICNYRGQPYDIWFIGDMESSYSERTIVDSELESRALAVHLKWGKAEDFWAYEYNYRSSVASALHGLLKEHLKVPGAGKPEEVLTKKERDLLEPLEHRRWNAYMRSEGYVFSGSTHKSSRNDLAKMHHDLVPFEGLSEKDKRKDSAVATK